VRQVLPRLSFQYAKCIEQPRSTVSVVLVLAVVAAVFGAWMATMPSGFAHVAHTVRIGMPDASDGPGIPRIIRGTGFVLLALAALLVLLAALP
jgi:hypothetical protein